MQQYPFIFSYKKRYRILRHLSFWVFWWLFMSSLYVFTPSPSGLTYLQRIPNAAADGLFYLSCHAFLSYSLMYFVIPNYVIKAKYTLAALFSFLLILATGALSALVSVYLLIPAKQWLLPSYLIVEPPPIKRGDLTVFHLALLAGLRGAITVGGIAAAIKLMKHWYVEGQKNMLLQKENAEAQLQLLKAQVHPHFLFNTLNNIYSKTQNTSVAASEMIFSLSDILRYMLYECNKPLVPLSRELKMMEEYINLEKVRYGNELELHLELPEVTEGHVIAPLMMLPFIENCFKHGASNMLYQPWVSLTVTIEGDEMMMKLLNSKAQQNLLISNHGIGIENAKKRLELLYPGKYQLAVQQETEVFIVTLKLRLEKKYLAPVVADTFTHSSIVN